MNKKRKTLIALLSFVIFLAIAGAAYQYLSNVFDPNSSLNTKKIAAADFTVLDADGNEVKLSDSFGKPIVLNFWASWCTPCQREMPHFEKVYPEVKEDVVFLIVDLADGIRESTETGSRFIEENDYSFPVFFDTKQEAAKAYKITAIPTTFFIDKDGNIVSDYQGALNEKKLLERIEAIR
ncbi:TlpA family protein disulfide reductase [Clostridium aminobutyricum]|uniref:Redoxin domain-containing protein n=1 Tax=Clostridium aminobutyricum TaxID=33953 RepID=A0A939D8S5_CLOAM|nr:redoxin domain-containing protein [Clostridium aminobutyricum]MBN7773266.1 redoxin domain-containing protein [Clostridium aminobutyricum]